MFVGIDVSKETIDLAYLESINQWTSLKINNKVEDFRKFIKTIPTDAHCVMEATGAYYLTLACFLYENGFKVSVVNPLVIKRYSQMKMRRTKTDKADAKIIAEYAREQQPELWKPTDKVIAQIQQINSALDKLTQQRAAWKNKDEAQDKNPNGDDFTQKIIDETLDFYDNKIKEVEAKLDEIVKNNFSEMNAILRSIPGIGPKTATALIVITGGFEKFETYKQLISYVGLAPRIYQSGTSVKGKSPICKMGMKKIRQLLYLCSWTAKEANLACRILFERLVQKGKNKKLVLIAVANKLLKQAFTIVKKNEFYNPLFT
jgi:transposase